MNNQIIIKKKEYIYDNQHKIYLANLKPQYTNDMNEAINFRNWWILKYLILKILRFTTKNKNLRLRKYVNYEPNYHCF